jgi:hypothetical protein
MQAAENQKEEHHQDDQVKLRITVQQRQKTSKK